MNPTANKSDFEDLTTNLKDLAYSYLEKYSPSKQQLKVYLLKKYLTKIKGTKSKKEVTSIIDKIILNLESIRDTIAFPKTQSSSCLMTDAPSDVDTDQLNDLSLSIKEPIK